MRTRSSIKLLFRIINQFYFRTNSNFDIYEFFYGDLSATIKNGNPTSVPFNSSQFPLNLFDIRMYIFINFIFFIIFYSK